MYSNERDPYRAAIKTAWRKHQLNETLSALEREIVAVIILHPEYQTFLTDQQSQQDFSLSDNPFFHISLHLSVRDQLRLNQPHGITNIHQSLSIKLGDPHSAEHLMMECLGKVLWDANAKQQAPNIEDYMKLLREAL